VTVADRRSARHLAPAAAALRRVGIAGTLADAYPDMPLKNFINIDKLAVTVPGHARNYAWTAQVDVLRLEPTA
jgi:hypothetical protein